MPIGCLPVLFFLWFLLWLPVLMADVMMGALLKLGLHPAVAFHAVSLIFIGSLINIPVVRIPRRTPVQTPLQNVFGFKRWLPEFHPNETVVAVNMGGCLVPVALCFYEWLRLLVHAPSTVPAALASVAINSFVCYKTARIVPGLGIAMPTFVAPVTAVVCALTFAPTAAVQVAFLSGVLGPLIGADVLHLKDIDNIDSPMVSIGGAGTFDGIVVSGLMAVLLA